MSFTFLWIIIIEPCSYQKMKIKTYTWRDNLINALLNNYFDVGLKSRWENKDTQPVLNEYKAVAYMCQYF